jgi:hypothetical protein
LLIQGSVQPPPIKIKRAAWENALCDAVAGGYGISWQDWKVTEVLDCRAGELAETVFSQASHNERR